MEKSSKRRRTITIERVTVTTMRSKQKFFCNVCGQEVEPVTHIAIDGVTHTDQGREVPALPAAEKKEDETTGEEK